MQKLKTLQTSNLLGREFTIYGTAENPLFLAKDVAEMIGHSNVSKMMRMIDKDEKVKIFCNLPQEDTITKGYNPCKSATYYGTNRMFVTEDGLYEILMQSNLPIAKEFKKGVKTILKEIRKNGVRHKGGAVHSYGGNTLVSEMRTEEEAVEDAVTAIKHSMREVMNVVNMIDNAMANLKDDPYYNILEMRYFEGMGQEDIGKALNCTQPNVSYHKNRLIRELSVQMFPNEVAKELLQ